MATAVMGVRGGVGATRLVVALAVAADAVVLDLDDLAGGIDVWLGGEDVPGVRWSGLTLAGGALAADQLVNALPSVDGLRVLAADRAGAPDVAAVAQVLDLLASRPAVVDLPRVIDDRAVTVLERCDSLLLLTPATIGGGIAAHTIATVLAGVVPVGLIVVGTDEPAGTIGAATGLPVVASARDGAGLERFGDALAAGIADVAAGPERPGPDRPGPDRPGPDRPAPDRPDSGVGRADRRARRSA